MSDGTRAVTSAKTPTKRQRHVQPLTAVAGGSSTDESTAESINNNNINAVNINNNAGRNVNSRPTTTTGTATATAAAGNGKFTTAEDRAAMEFGDGYRRILEAIGEPGYNSMKALFYGEDGPPAGTIPSITVSFELFEAVQNRFATTKATLERTKADLHKQHQLYAVLQGQYDQLQETYNILEHRAGDLERNNTQLHQDIAKQGVTAEQLRQQIGRMKAEMEMMEKKMMKRDEELQVTQQRVAEGLLLLSQKETIIANLRRQLGRTGRGRGQDGILGRMGAEGEEYTAEALRRIADDVEDRSIEAQLRLCVVELEAKVRNVEEERRYVMLRHTLYRKHVQDVTQAYEALCMAEEDAVHSHVCKVPTPPETPLQLTINESNGLAVSTTSTLAATAKTTTTTTTTAAAAGAKKTGGKEKGKRKDMDKSSSLPDSRSSLVNSGRGNQEGRASVSTSHHTGDVSFASLGQSSPESTLPRREMSLTSSPQNPIASLTSTPNMSPQRGSQQTRSSLVSVNIGDNVMSSGGKKNDAGAKTPAASVSGTSSQGRKEESQKKGEGNTQQSNSYTKESSTGSGKRTGETGVSRQLSGSTHSPSQSYKSSRDVGSKSNSLQDSPRRSFSPKTPPRGTRTRRDRTRNRQPKSSNSVSRSESKIDVQDQGVQTEFYPQRQSRDGSVRLSTSASAGQGGLSPTHFTVPTTSSTSIPQAGGFVDPASQSRSTGTAEGGMYSSARGERFSSSGGVLTAVLPSFAHVNLDGYDDKRQGSFFSISAGEKGSSRRVVATSNNNNNNNNSNNNTDNNNSNAAAVAASDDGGGGGGGMENKEKQEINQRLHALTGNYATLHGLLLDLTELLCTKKGERERVNSLEPKPFHLDENNNENVVAKAEYVSDTVAADTRILEHLLRLLQRSSSRTSSATRSVKGGVPPSVTTTQKKGGATLSDSHGYEELSQNRERSGNINSHVSDTQMRSSGIISFGSPGSSTDLARKLGTAFSNSGSNVLKGDGGLTAANATEGSKHGSSGTNITKKNTDGTTEGSSRSPRHGAIDGDVKEEKVKQHVGSDKEKGEDVTTGATKKDINTTTNTTTTTAATAGAITDEEKQGGVRKVSPRNAGNNRSESTKKRTPQVPTHQQQQQQRGFTRYGADGTSYRDNIRGGDRGKQTRETRAASRARLGLQPPTNTNTTNSTTNLPKLPAKGGEEVVYDDKTPRSETGVVEPILPTLPSATPRLGRNSSHWTRRVQQRTPWSPAVIHIDFGDLDVEHGGAPQVSRPFHSYHQYPQSSAVPWSSFFNRALGGTGVPTKMSNIPIGFTTNTNTNNATPPRPPVSGGGSGRTSPVAGPTAGPTTTTTTNNNNNIGVPSTYQYFQPYSSPLPYNLSRFITPSQTSGPNTWESRYDNLMLGGTTVLHPASSASPLGGGTYPPGSPTQHIHSGETTSYYPTLSYLDQLSEEEAASASPSTFAIAGRSIGETHSTTRSTKTRSTNSPDPTNKEEHSPPTLPIPRQYVIADVLRRSPVVSRGGRHRSSSNSTNSNLRLSHTARSFWRNMLLLRAAYMRQRQRVQHQFQPYIFYNRPRWLPLFEFHPKVREPAADLRIGRPRGSINNTRRRTRREVYAKRPPRRFSFERRLSLLRSQYGGSPLRRRQQQQQEQQQQQQQRPQQYQLVPFLIHHWGGEHPQRTMR